MQKLSKARIRMATAVAAVVSQMQGAFNPVDAESASQAAWEGQCALTKKQRFIGFAGCVCFGLLISFLSFIFLTRPTVFALLYTIGNLVSVASTGFLVGKLIFVVWRKVIRDVLEL